MPSPGQAEVPLSSGYSHCQAKNSSWQAEVAPAKLKCILLSCSPLCLPASSPSSWNYFCQVEIIFAQPESLSTVTPQLQSNCNSCYSTTLFASLAIKHHFPKSPCCNSSYSARFPLIAKLSALLFSCTPPCSPVTSLAIQHCSPKDPSCTSCFQLHSPLQTSCKPCYSVGLSLII